MSSEAKPKSTDAKPKRTPAEKAARRRARDFWRRLRLVRNLVAFGLILGFVLLFHRIVHVVPAGHSAVLFRPLFGGLVTDRVFGEGLHITSPWNKLTVYDTRIEERMISVPALAKNGLTILVDVSARFFPVVAELPKIHRRLGPEYVRKLVIPVVISSVRDVTGHYDHEDLFDVDSQVVEDRFLSDATEEVREHGIVIEELIIRRMIMPKRINTAIEEKLRHQQLAAEYVFRLDREVQEAQRKVIEAEGIRRYQELIQSNLSEKMLRWHGVKATLDLAESPNSKVVVIGGGGGEGGGTGIGLPIILGGWDQQKLESEPMGHAVTSGMESVSMSTFSSQVQTEMAYPEAVLGAAMTPPSDQQHSAPMAVPSADPDRHSHGVNAGTP